MFKKLRLEMSLRKKDKIIRYNQYNIDIENRERRLLIHANYPKCYFFSINSYFIYYIKDENIVVDENSNLITRDKGKILDLGELADLVKYNYRRIPKEMLNLIKKKSLI